MPLILLGPLDNPSILPQSFPLIPIASTIEPNSILFPIFPIPLIASPIRPEKHPIPAFLVF